MEIITRTEAPTKLDTAEYKTVCKTTAFNTEAQYYIQMSEDSENPRWEKMTSEEVDKLINS